MRPFPEPGLAAGPEAERIRAFLEEAGAGAGLAEPSVTVTIPPGDDAAAFRLATDEQVVVSTDASVEGIHFRRAWMTWETVGYRAAASALSDLAAMAAAPIGLLISVALPPESGIETAAALGRGVGMVAGRMGARVLGGDLVASPGPVFIDVTVLGCAGSPRTRAGARPGDELWVTGELGAAAVALHDLERGLEPDGTARAAFERPCPRIREALWLADRIDVQATIDLSDGLLRDARHLAAASGVALRIDAARIPAASPLDGFREMPAGQRLVLAGGEDYELLLAVPSGAMRGTERAFAAAFDLPLTRIGTVHRGEGVRVDGLADPEDAGGFDHFASGP
ncbi:thiamine-phosphate kinase [Candidatus Palauibacter sp.]|uniref:thiamine-phosphate kinase n=1 Tax=Candidatus Palauibacter sp. TaxID=3101350 RepID=UPI003B010DD6